MPLLLRLIPRLHGKPIVSLAVKPWYLADYEDYTMPSDDQLKELRESNKLVIWVLGGPGSGKGTQCDKIVAKYNFTHISTGDLLRAEVQGGSERGKSLNAIMKEGALVPMNVVLALLAEKMIATVKTSNGFLIDGYPRELAQGQEFEKSIKPCDLVLYMKASDATLKARLLKRAETSGRTDDNEETILKRLKTFHDHSDPIINNYTSKVKEIDSERDPEVIFADVVQAIDGVKK
ncbi:adenylate kinase isoenzyme 1 isoform X1 [Macrosteles quadrilineatus]|uniref:adenylate kinase isoenzyme 1 isoform X1 n=2 Tax=Macrosteles quadrilineatus TaxID=74068 RepID=UPI0023E10412|nr:adenylate kinase isoenzyme 1 isoform X1 [Macrosteles quadrilineatus]